MPIMFRPFFFKFFFTCQGTKLWKHLKMAAILHTILEFEILTDIETPWKCFFFCLKTYVFRHFDNDSCVSGGKVIMKLLYGSHFGRHLALHELDFCLYFSLENSILSCVTVGLQHILQHLKNCHFHLWYTYFQIKHWNMLYNVHTCIAIFFHIKL